MPQSDCQKSDLVAVLLDRSGGELGDSGFGGGAVEIKKANKKSLACFKIDWLMEGCRVVR